MNNPVFLTQRQTEFWHRMTRSLLVLWILAGGTAFSRAQPYDLSWFTIDGGGGTSTGGVYSVSGTIGQPDAGLLTGGRYQLVGGFWGVVLAVQTPGAPLLTARRSGPSVIVSWNLPASGFVLEQTSTLSGTPPPWAQVAFPYQTNATDIFISTPAPAGDRFYRLRKP